MVGALTLSLALWNPVLRVITGPWAATLQKLQTAAQPCANYSAESNDSEGFGDPPHALRLLPGNKFYEFGLGDVRRHKFRIIIR